MDKGFSLEILTPERTLFSGEVTSLVAPGALGYLGVLASHAPLVTTLVPGNITCRTAGGGLQIFRSAGAGFLEVYQSRAVLLADKIEG